MSLLVFGATGQVARELRALAPEATFLDRAAADLTDPAACAEAIRHHAPSAVINAAAYTAVDRAEEEEALATLVNGEAPGAMARACAALGIPMVHLSTDYVFDGSGTRPWTPDDPVAPLGAYGRSKLAGEEAVRAAGGVHVILRTSWVFSAHGGNFVKTMLRLSESRDALTIVSDQSGGPTPADAIAAACLRIAAELQRDPAKTGTYHFAGRPQTSWAEFARAIFARAGRNVSVTDIPTADYPTPARRPLNSRLNCDATEAAFGISCPDWRQALDDVLSSLKRGQGMPKHLETRISLAPPKEKICFDGERCSPWVRAPIWAEHLHRYLAVLPICDGRKLLDIACGEGYGAALLAGAGAAHVSGVDIDAEIIARADRIYGSPNLDFHCASILDPLPFEDDAFDLITCFETIEHVDAQQAAIAELCRVLQPGGILVISTPDKNHPSVQGSTNPFHEKELDETEFRALLAPHFSNVRACYQRNVTGSIMVDENGDFGPAPEFWERDGFINYVATPAPRQMQYIILWASDRPLPPPGLGFLHDGVLKTLINKTVQRDGWT